MAEPLLDIQDAPIDAGETTPDSSNARSTAPKGTKGKGLLGKLGDNRKTRGGPRRLVKADTERLAGVYALIGMAVYPRNQRLGYAIGESAQSCAEAWTNWAEQNDAVRRAILWLIEGGAAGAVLFAHLPILIAGIPEDKLPPVVAMLIPQQSENGQGQGEEAPENQPAFVEWPPSA